MELGLVSTHHATAITCRNSRIVPPCATALETTRFKNTSREQSSSILLVDAVIVVKNLCSLGVIHRVKKNKTSKKEGHPYIPPVTLLVMEMPRTDSIAGTRRANKRPNNKKPPTGRV
jgi:hypothetical protein